MVIFMNIKQGDIWLVKFYPKVGNEISKLRPAVVVSCDSMGRLPLKTIIPITEWKDRYKNYPWIVEIKSNASNGLSKNSAADCFQIKNFSIDRFERKIGSLKKEELIVIHQTIIKTLNPLYQLIEI